MVRTRLSGSLAATALLLSTFVASVLVPRAALAVSAVYDVVGTAVTTPGDPCGSGSVIVGDQDVDPACANTRTTGTATCSVCIAGAPTSGTFSLVTIYEAHKKAHPTDPYRVRRVFGIVRVSWSDGRFSWAQVAGRFRGGKHILSLAGTIAADSTFRPTDPYRGLVNGYPTDPYNTASTATIDGAFSFG